MVLAKEKATLSNCLEDAPPIAAPHSSTDPRAARLAKFEREQLIVDDLNRGVSVAEIAALVGVGNAGLVGGFAQVDAKVAFFSVLRRKPLERLDSRVDSDRLLGAERVSNAC